MINSWELIAEANNIEIGEEFLFRQEGQHGTEKCKIVEDEFLVFDEKGCIWHNWDYTLLYNFLAGKGKIEKIPFEPVFEEEYWTIEFVNDAFGTIEPHVAFTTWCGHKEDYYSKLLGLVFRTEAEALNYLPIFKEKLIESGWIENE